VSFVVQTFASLHAMPSGAAGFEQTPVAGEQVPASWHPSLGAHTTGLPPAHAPETHVSDWVQPLPSLHAAPSGPTGFEQVPVAGAHVPAR
jgi:hypothetical protein